jgi:hypothetical protein
MRTVVKMAFAVAVLALMNLGGLAMRASHAQGTDYPWCVIYQGEDADGGEHCMFISYGQCMATATPGSGGTCVRNRRFDSPPERHFRH